MTMTGQQRPRTKSKEVGATAKYRSGEAPPQGLSLLMAGMDSQAQSDTISGPKCLKVP